MEVIPALDLRGGRCVRLYQGDFGREEVVGEDPVAVARRWADLGAPRLHIVDLDGARQGRPVHREVVRAIRRAVTVPLQVGGGIRDLETARAYRAMGVERVVLGTALFADPDLPARLVDALGPEAVVAGVDARNGRVAVQGWQEETPLTVEEAVQRLREAGLLRFLYTDVLRDGTLQGPDLEGVARLVGMGVRVLASGGIASLEDLRALARAGAEGAIVGRALYRGLLDLPSALRAVGT